MSVYFVTCRQANAVKIGSSGEPQQRVKEIQWGCPLPVKLEAVMPGNHEREFELHRRFADDRLTGEWFSLNEIIETMIEANPAPAPPEKTPYARYRAPWHSKTLAARVRAKLQVTQVDLAKMLGIEPYVLRKYEHRGRAPQEIEAKLNDLADAQLAQLARLGPKERAA